ncbi:lysylphosphatidylglycerol synthase transmembrane domain-containing protein [Phaeovulum sp. W22_SRMD_FR3]|uniref:lysylphosphatidylglycerol synthase transmembrane domain-containing protein n=1 Tax=Phaeovulum sp. W22_SRMD_FR3 TaxID=3240274 RepID=UPI003F9CD509
MRASRISDRLLIGGLVLALVLGLAGLASATGWREIGAQLARLSVAQLALLLLLSLVNYGLRGLRWHVLARRLGLPTALRQNLRHYLGGFAMAVTPGRLGELVRMRWLRRETGWAVERTAPLALMDRAGDLAVMALLLGAATLLAGQGQAGLGAALPVTLAGLLLAVLLTRPTVLARILTQTYRLTGWKPALFARARRASRSLTRFSHPATLVGVLGLGLLGWLAEGYAFHLLLSWMGADIGLWTAIGIFTFATLAGGLTGAPGGLGGAEAAMVALLSLNGVGLDISVPATAVIRLTTLWFALALGLAVFPLAEARAAASPHP